MGINRTNITIEDPQAWNFVKLRKNHFHSKTISSELFRMINLYRNSQIDIDIANFLISIEKFYETHYYTAKDVCHDLQISQSTFLSLVDNNLGDVKIYGHLTATDISYARNKIHNLMAQFSILPREYYLLQKLKLIFEYNALSDKQKMITVMYPDAEVRRLEIYNCIFQFLDEIIDHKIDLNIFKDQWKEYINQDVKFFYYMYGIEIEAEDYTDDLISDILLENVHQDAVMPFYNYLIEFAVSRLIQKNLTFLKEYLAQHYFFSEKLIPKLENSISALHDPKLDALIPANILD